MPCAGGFCVGIPRRTSSARGRHDLRCEPSRGRPAPCMCSRARARVRGAHHPRGWNRCPPGRTLRTQVGRLRSGCANALDPAQHRGRGRQDLRERAKERKLEATGSTFPSSRALRSMRTASGGVRRRCLPHGSSRLRPAARSGSRTSSAASGVRSQRRQGSRACASTTCATASRRHCLPKVFTLALHSPRSAMRTSRRRSRSTATSSPASVAKRRIGLTRCSAV